MDCWRGKCCWKAVIPLAKGETLSICIKYMADLSAVVFVLMFSAYLIFHLLDPIQVDAPHISLLTHPIPRHYSHLHLLARTHTHVAQG